MTIAERRYGSTPLPAYHDPDREGQEPTCHCCGGRGSRKFFDSDIGWTFGVCMLCHGVATAGVFVVQVVTDRYRFEATWHSFDFLKAETRALHLANRFTARDGVCLGHPATEVRAVFKPNDRRLPEEVVAVFAIRASSFPRAA
jgi:hypothetical protein